MPSSGDPFSIARCVSHAGRRKGAAVRFGARLFGVRYTDERARQHQYAEAKKKFGTAEKKYRTAQVLNGYSMQ